MSMTEQELQRRLDANRAISAKAKEIKERQEAEKAERQRTEAAAQKEAAATTEARELSALKSESAGIWPGSAESFEKFWANGGAEQVRIAEFTRRLQNRKPVATLD